MRRLSGAAAFAGLVLGFLIALVAPAAPASAHAVLQSTEPATDAVLSQAPQRVTLTFSEPVQLLDGRVQVLAPDNSRVEQGQPSVSGSTITINLNSQQKGTYLVSYRVVSADSHPIAGSFPYSVGAPSASPTATDVSSAVDPLVGTAIPVVKGLGYAGLLLTIGPIMVLALLWPHRLSRRGPARVLWAGLGLVAGSTLAGLWLQAPYTTGGGIFDVGVDDLRDVLGTRYGAVMLVRLGVLCACAVLVRPLSRGAGESRADLALLAVLGVAAVGTWPLTGHPTASPVSGVSVVADAVHLAAMAAWLGGLVMLTGFLLPRANERELDAILPIWSRWATAAVAALIVAGTIQALIEIGTFTALATTTYGRLLLVKIGLVAVVLAVAAYSRRLVRRQAAAGRARLRRVILVELAITSAVLAVTAVLVQTTPARTASATTTAAPASTAQVSTTLKNDTLSLQVTVYPGQVGNNAIHLYAYTLDGTALPIVEWTATAALPARNIEPIEVALVRITDNHAIGDVGLPAAGPWQLRFTLRTSDVDQSTVTGTVTVS
ncbi:copper resistance protein CopC [Actinoplanes sp. ATCC 53533]|uniref:copper resistance CopC/CopD family protein n=1 Tax=Actinoplanes sp. ATCC 53533 TaxID=1288362 RepID=UPI000F7701C3|nr:copper resistance protein CopC [Actinoplanes sp. ATCC 53533]RSM71637.1 copper resistance protein CopC [Actinoplanes sp. ATCC 53533]